MSLNWNATKCGEAWEALDPYKRESVIFHTMFTDMGQITEANAEEFFQRYIMWNRALGNDAPLYLSAADVKAAIGLSTNVATTTFAAYKKRIIKVMEQKAHEMAHHQFKLLEEEQSNESDHS